MILDNYIAGNVHRSYLIDPNRSHVIKKITSKPEVRKKNKKVEFHFGPYEATLQVLLKSDEKIGARH